MQAVQENIYWCNQCGKRCSNIDTRFERELVFEDVENDIHICSDCSIDWEERENNELVPRGTKRNINNLVDEYLEKEYTKYCQDMGCFDIDLKDHDLTYFEFDEWVEMVSLSHSIAHWSKESNEIIHFGYNLR